MKKCKYLCLFFVLIISVVRCAIEDVLSSNARIESDLLSENIEEHIQGYKNLVQLLAKKFQSLLKGIENFVFDDAVYREAGDKAPGTHMRRQGDPDLPLNSFSSAALYQSLFDLACMTNRSLSIDDKLDPNTMEIADGFSREQAGETYYKLRKAIEFIKNKTLNEDHEENKIFYLNAEQKVKDDYNIHYALNLEFINISERIFDYSIEHKIIQQISSNLSKEKNYNKDMFLIYALINYYYQKFNELELSTVEYFFLKDNSKLSQALKQATAFTDHIITNKPVKDLKIDFNVFKEMISGICYKFLSNLDYICYENPTLNRIFLFQKCISICEAQNFNEIRSMFLEIRNAFDSFKKEINQIRLSQKSLRILSISEDDLGIMIILCDIMR